MGLQLFDDGSSVTTNAAGDVVSVTDSAGYTFAPDRSIASDFLGSLSKSVGSYINRALNPPLTTAQQAMLLPPNALTLHTVLTLGVMAVIGVGAFALLKKS